MVDKETRRSRRAKRRDEQEAADDAGEATEAIEAEAGDESESDADDAGESESDADDAGGEAEADEAEAGSDAADEDEAAVAEEPEPEEKPARLRTSGKKKKKKKRAASSGRIRDRNERIRERAAARRRERAEGLAAGEMVDDALARSTQAATNWIKDHFNIVQWVIIAMIAGGVGWEIYSWHHDKQVEKASDKLIAAVQDETGKLPGDDVSGPEADFDPRKSFPSAKARNEAAEKSYQAAESVAKGSGSSILATLGLAGVQYDQGKFGDAQKNYESVKDSALAKHDLDVKGRAIEGIGLCLEAQDKLDAADKAFREMENLEAPGLTSLALYHQARIAFSKGDKDKAEKLLTKVQKKLEDSDSPYPPDSYLSTMSKDLMRTINPAAAPPPGRPGMQLTAAQIEKLKAQIKQDPTKLKEVMKEMGLQLPPPTTQAPEAPPAPEEESTGAPSDSSPAPAPAPKGKSPPTPAPKPKSKPAPTTRSTSAPAPAPKPPPAPAPAGSAP